MLSTSSSNKRGRSPSEDGYQEDVDMEDAEPITVDTHIKPDNVGFALLAKFGWQQGQALGLSEDARTEPVPFVIKQERLGLGKITQDTEMVANTVAQRRDLDSERHLRETPEQRQARIDAVASRQAISATVSATLSAFNCTLCSKQFNTVTAYDEHCRSYSHAHKARAADLAKSAAAARTGSTGEAAREKERKREEKELRKAAKAAGMKIPKSALPPSLPGPSIPIPPSEPKNNGGGGWAKIAPASEPRPSNPFLRGGFETLDGQPPTPPPAPETVAPLPPAPTTVAPSPPGPVNVAPPPPLPLTPPPPEPDRHTKNRSGWQQFQNKRR